LLAVVAVAGPDPTLGAIVAVLTATFGVALARVGWTTLSTGWPRFDPAATLARIGWYNATIALATGLGAAIDALSVPGIGTICFAAAVSIVAIRTLPAAASWTTVLLSSL
jgi:hypothetical protein